MALDRGQAEKSEKTLNGTLRLIRGAILLGVALPALPLERSPYTSPALRKPPGGVMGGTIVKKT